MRLTVLVSLVAFSLVGCVPKLKAEYYLVFENVQGMRILSKSNEIAIQYRLDRDNHSLRMLLDEKSGLRVFLKAVDAQGLTLKISNAVVKGFEHCSSFSLPFRSDKLPDPEGTLVLNWLHLKSGCDLDSTEERSLSLSLQILDQQGRLLGVERIPFELRYGGMKVTVDSI